MGCKLQCARDDDDDADGHWNGARDRGLLHLRSRKRSTEWKDRDSEQRPDEEVGNACDNGQAPRPASPGVAMAQR